MKRLSPALLLATLTLCRAELVEVTLTLTPPVAAANILDLELSVPVAGSDNDPTRVRGEVSAQIDIDPETGVISSLTINSATLTGTPVTFASGGLLASYDLSTTFLGGTITTPGPPAPVSAAGQSPAEQHTFTINSGRLSGTAVTIGRSMNVNGSFAIDPFSGQGDAGTFVTITAVRNAASTSSDVIYDLSLSYPLNLTQEIDVQPGVAATIRAVGTLQAEGVANIPLDLPNPYLEWVASNNLTEGSFEGFGASSLLPNGLLWALGYQATEVPAILTARRTELGAADAEFRLALPEAGTAGEVLIESSSDLEEPWTPAPASEVSTGANPLPIGTTGEVVVTPPAGERLFYRLRANDPATAPVSP